MNYADIKKYDIANGVGVRVSLFVSGCRHHCKGCFNQEAWDFTYGKPFPKNQQDVLLLLRRFKKEFPDKTVWCYTGYDFEADLLPLKIGDEHILSEILRSLDVLVDGKFIEALKSKDLRFRGSSNQRILDVAASLSAGKAVLLPGNWNIEH